LSDPKGLALAWLTLGKFCDFTLSPGPFSLAGFFVRLIFSINVAFFIALQMLRQCFLESLHSCRVVLEAVKHYRYLLLYERLNQPELWEWSVSFLSMSSPRSTLVTRASYTLHEGGTIGLEVLIRLVFNIFLVLPEALSVARNHVFYNADVVHVHCLYMVLILTAQMVNLRALKPLQTGHWVSILTHFGRSFDLELDLKQSSIAEDPILNVQDHLSVQGRRPLLYPCPEVFLSFVSLIEGWLLLPDLSNQRFQEMGCEYP
jgi:hypothetical protein